MKAYRQNGKIIIELDEQNIIDGSEDHSHWDAKVTDRERFLNYVTMQLVTAERPHQDDLLINELLDCIVQAAIEGNEGIEPR